MDQWNKTVNTNLSSTFLTQLIANFMVKSKINGSIINITSLALNLVCLIIPPMLLLKVV